MQNCLRNSCLDFISKEMSPLASSAMKHLIAMSEEILKVCHSWRRGSTVRTSVFGWRSFSELRLIYGWHVTTSWVKCPLWVNQPGQLSLPSLQGR